MTGYRGADRLQSTVLDRLTALVMAEPRRHPAPIQSATRVAALADVADGVRRITFQASEFTPFVCTGPDEYFGLLIPQHSTELIRTRRALEEGIEVGKR